MSKLLTIVEKLFPENHHLIQEDLLKLVEQNKKDGGEHSSDWYKYIRLYVTYPDSFVTGGKASLYTLAAQLSRLHNLGFNAVHVLPLFESPLVDGGFDIADFYHAREGLGGDDALEFLLQEAKKYQMAIFTDFVLNHISEEHEWFVKAQEGDEYYQNLFHHRQEKPELQKVEHGRAYYKDGEHYFNAEIIFPDHAGDCPHWRQGKDGKWYFHTFYPSQIDLNWYNPYVFLEACKIMAYWATKGINFRIDAAQHFDKDFIGDQVKNTNRNFLLLGGIRSFLNTACGDAEMLLEVVDAQHATLPYFSNEQADNIHLAYSFESMNALWICLMIANKYPLQKVLEDWRHMEGEHQWVSFLRSHDAYMPGFTDDQDAIARTREAMSHRGKAFGAWEIAGRAVDFLDKDIYRVGFAHALLYSLPAIPAVYYGDEVMKENDELYMESVRVAKQLSLPDKEVLVDARDLNRGRIHSSILHTTEADKLQGIIRRLNKLRERFFEMATQHPEIIPDLPETVLGLKYKTHEGELEIFANIGFHDAEIHLPHVHNTVFSLHGVMVEKDKVVLGSNSCVWVLV